MKTISIFSETGLVLYGMKELFICCSLKLLTRRYIFKLTKYEREVVSRSIDSDDRNFRFVGLAELSLLKRSQL